jgi:hypothetical protein
MKWIQKLLTIDYGFGLMQITQVSKVASLIPLTMFVMEWITSQRTIIEEAITTTDPDIIGISSMLDAEDRENSEGMCNIDHQAASPYTIHTAVLPKPSLIDANVNSAITSMLDIVQPKNDDVNEDETYE